MQWQLNTPNDLEGITEQKVDARTRAFIPLYSCMIRITQHKLPLAVCRNKESAAHWKVKSALFLLQC